MIMSAPVPVLSLQSVAIEANWLGRMLAPSAEACRFERVPGVELLPQTQIFGRHNGSVNPYQTAHRVQLGLGLSLTHKEQIQYVYLHECAHLVLCNAVKAAKQRMDYHGPAFLLTLMTLIQRVDDATEPKRPIFRKIDLYDYQDCPPFLQHLKEHEWRPLILAFALKHYKRLASSNLSAEQIGEEARKLWMESDGLALYDIDTELKKVKKSLADAQCQLSERANFFSASIFYTALSVAAVLSCLLTASAIFFLQI